MSKGVCAFRSSILLTNLLSHAHHTMMKRGKASSESALIVIENKYKHFASNVVCICALAASFTRSHTLHVLDNQQERVSDAACSRGGISGMNNSSWTPFFFCIE